MFKPFYIHEHRGPGKISGRSPRGFTLKVAQDPNNESHVNVQGTWCSHKDQFCKREGRKFADAAEIVSINKRNLPALAADMTNTIFGSVEYSKHNFYYLLQYVV